MLEVIVGKEWRSEGMNKRKNERIRIDELHHKMWYSDQSGQKRYLYFGRVEMQWRYEGEGFCDKACRCLVVNFTKKVRKRVHPQIDKYLTQREWYKSVWSTCKKGALLKCGGSLMDSKKKKRKKKKRKPLLLENTLEVSVVRRKLDFSVIKSRADWLSSEVIKDGSGFAYNITKAREDPQKARGEVTSSWWKMCGWAGLDKPERTYWQK